MRQILPWDKAHGTESGLGGLPIEADMRYTGGFMPYGAREKADDVPARLSKNEFDLLLTL